MIEQMITDVRRKLDMFRENHGEIPVVIFDPEKGEYLPIEFTVMIAGEILCGDGTSALVPKKIAEKNRFVVCASPGIRITEKESEKRGPKEKEPDESLRHKPLLDIKNIKEATERACMEDTLVEALDWIAVWEHVQSNNRESREHCFSICFKFLMKAWEEKHLPASVEVKEKEITRDESKLSGWGGKVQSKIQIINEGREFVEAIVTRDSGGITVRFKIYGTDETGCGSEVITDDGFWPHAAEDFARNLLKLVTQEG